MNGGDRTTQSEDEEPSSNITREGERKRVDAVGGGRTDGGNAEGRVGTTDVRVEVVRRKNRGS